MALENIHRNRGAATPGVDGLSLSGFSTEDIERIQKEIAEEVYQPSPVRRVMIPKKSGGSRPLGIPTRDDRVVQEVCRIVLETIYEPVFSESSFGFRPNRSCQLALEQIRRVWKGTKWFLEFDIRGCFDNINHQRMVEILGKRIEDQKFLRLLGRFLKCGVLDGWEYQNTYSGTPQGGVVSPILANIYLHELDQFAEELCQKHTVAVRRQRYRPAERATARLQKRRGRIRKLKTEGDPDRQLPDLLASASELHNEILSMPAYDQLHDPFRRLRYCRYADDFLFGFIGPKAEAYRIAEEIKRFIGEHLKLECSPAKTRIRHATKGTRVLGYDVHSIGRKRKHFRKRKTQKGWTRVRVANEIIRLHIPLETAEKFCAQHGFGNFSSIEALPAESLLNSDMVDIVHRYNRVLRGWCNYYAIADNATTLLHRVRFL